MLQELKIKNFLSFKEEVTFSFEATKDTTFEEYQVVKVAPGVRLLRFAMIYGANASGKSNLLYSLEFLRHFWFDIKKDITEDTGAIPFKFNRKTQAEPSCFSLKFYVNGVRYWYQLELDDKSIILEKLYFYSSVQPTLLFERELDLGISIVKFNNQAIKISSVAKEEINIKCLPNMSFFAARNQVNVILPKIDDARDWMKNNLMQPINPKIGLFDYAQEKLSENDELKKLILGFIKEADFNISDIKTKEERNAIPEELVDIFIKTRESLSDEEIERIRKEKTLAGLSTDFEHTVINENGVERYFLEDIFESDGTRRTAGLQAAVYTSLKRNAFLSIDEVEASLHPYLILFILKKFLEVNNSKSQLLITTHYDPLLNEVDELFRKDSVWFTEKNQAGSTELYSLVEFNGLNRIASLQKAYRQGRFGGIPKINL